MINLNDEQFASKTVKIFNNGEAGLVENVDIRVEKKQPSDPDNLPDYKLIAVDENEAEVNEGFYYFTPNPQNTDEKNQANQGYQISRLVHLARAVMGDDYTLPEVPSIKDAYDTVFKLVRDNAGSKKFNVYVTYGTVDRPSQYLGLRYFNFIEDAEGTSKLFPSKKDQLTRVQPDQPKEDVKSAASGWS